MPPNNGPEDGTTDPGFRIEAYDPGQQKRRRQHPLSTKRRRALPDWALVPINPEAR